MATARMPFPRDPRDDNTRRPHDTTPDTGDDTGVDFWSDGQDDTTPDTADAIGGEVVAFPNRRRHATDDDTRLDTGPDTEDDSGVDTDPDTGDDTDEDGDDADPSSRTLPNREHRLTRWPTYRPDW